MKKSRLVEVYVDGYKNLIDCTVAFDDFNVLVGPNNSGKSNFLEVFTFAREVVFGTSEVRKTFFERGKSPRGLLSLSLIEGHINKPISIALLMEDEDGVNQVRYSFSVQCSSYVLGGPNQSTLGFIVEDFSIKDKSKTGPAVTLMKREGDAFRIRTESGGFSTKPIGAMQSSLDAIGTMYPELKGLADEFSHAFEMTANVLESSVVTLEPFSLRRNLDQGGQASLVDYNVLHFDLIPAIVSQSLQAYDKFKAALCEVLDLEDAKLEKVVVPAEVRREMTDVPDEVYYFGLKMPGHLYSHIKNFSDGTLMVAAMLLMLYSPHRKGGLLCIEEPENSLHPKALKVLVRIFKEAAPSTQILITTHSPYMLSQVSLDELVIARSVTGGGTQLSRIKNTREVSRCIEDGSISYGDLFESGFLDENDEVITC